MTPLKLADGRYLYSFSVGFPEDGLGFFASHERPDWTTTALNDALGVRHMSFCDRIKEEARAEIEALGFVILEIPELYP